MTTNDLYFGIAAAVILIGGFILMMIVRARSKHDVLDMPKTVGDPLMDEVLETATAPDKNIKNWGDQVIGKPKILMTESPEERVARLHQGAEQAKLRQPYTKPPTIHATSSTQAVTKSFITAKEKNERNNIMVLYIMAHDKQHFNGYDLYQSLINAGLIYGKMRIFHYHQKHDTQKPVLFSVASAINPGSIDVDHIESFTTPGLTLFFNIDR
ncbi:MAG: cell division protein ZipA C-terminal FtsZ-binding domain-containing protein, partial [Gammaproteobacteria bacterium]